MIKIHEGQAGRMIRRANSNSRSRISEFAMSQVVEDRDAIFKRDGEIRQTIIVIVADGTRDALPLERQARFLCIDRDRGAILRDAICLDCIRAGLHGNDVLLTVAFHIQDAGSGTVHRSRGLP